MTEKFPRFSDADRVLKELEGTPVATTVKKALRKAMTSQSCLADLGQAALLRDALRDLLNNSTPTVSDANSSIEMALLMQAILLYSRATATIGQYGERGAVKITDHLSSEELEDHNALIEIRNKALAHVYHNEPVSNEVWHSGKLFFVEIKKGGWLPAGYNSSINFHPQTFARLSRMLPVAREILMTNFHQHTTKLTDALNKEPLTQAIFERCTFDPISLFGSDEAVTRALNGIPEKTAFGYRATQPKID
ncbi:hypothetical protein [Flavisphingomonas formosensis]|uniref:hypothetical protein n=1 Tax=Flavisphingomonas formosensis TaxID=861534 RepID=UPI0012F98966|nr:hypothetical protein [Sphingomonas formosensis]